MFGMEMAQENIQASLGNVKKPDFPEQSFYSESLNAEHEVEQKEQGMAPSNGPTIENQKHEEAVETKTETALDKIKAHADANGNGENETGFNAFDELENCIFSTVGDHLADNSRIYTTGGTTLVGAGIGALSAHRKAKKAGIKKGTPEYRKLMAKRTALGAATGLAVGEGAHIAKGYYNLHKGDKEIDKLNNPEAKKLYEKMRKEHGKFSNLMKSRQFGRFA